jgi:uncharacterized membrane protein
MFRNDWSPKPNLKAYTDLVYRDWWSNESATTDADGNASARVFKGDYDITISAPGYNTASRRPAISSNGLEMLIVLYP